MRLHLLLAAVLFLATGLRMLLSAGEADGFAAQFAAAERLHQEGSFALALERLQQAGKGEIPAAQRRRVAWLVADARWRAHLSNDNDDDSALDQARAELVALIDEPTGTAGNDEIWAQAQESLAISYWRKQQQSWDEAWPHFEAALDWWAGSSDLARARTRYLALISSIAQPVTDLESSSSGLQVPLAVLERALSIANSDEERGHLHYLCALAAHYALSNESRSDQRLRRRIVEELQAVIALDKASSWYGDALFDYGEHVASHGLPLKRDGRWTTVPGNRAALDSFRLLTSTFAKGAHRRVDDAERMIAQITALVLDLDITKAFVPGSLIAYDLRWRNLERIDLSLHRINLLHQSAATIGGESTALVAAIDLTNNAPLRTWKHEEAEGGEHEGHRASLRLDEPVPAGAYVLRAQASGLESRALLLVSDLTSIVVTGKDGALVYVCRVDDGAPVAGATVQVRQRRGERAQGEWFTTALTTDANGLCRAPVVKTGNSYQDILVLAASGDQQCFTTAGHNSWEQESHHVRLHAYTDRAAYRPGDTVHWKAIMRREQQGRLGTPAGTTLTYIISDPEGGPVAKGKATFNAFGSCWGEVALALGAPLGEYTISFQRDDEHEIGSATLFRVEEYKLPEFAVGVRTQGADGKPRTYRKGETVECTITADYYFGGPVAGAKVDVRIFVERYDAWWRRPAPFPWLEEPHENYGSDGDEVSRQLLTTDAAGRATLRFPAPRSGPDLSYRIEARLTDSSRREVIGSGEVKVTSQHYFVALDSPRGIYRPGDKAVARIHAYDANNQPVAVTGHLTVTRQWWDETWLSPEGKSLDRAALAAAGIDPRARLAAGEPWRCTFRGTREEEIFDQKVTTAANGDATVDFVPPRVGTYRMVYDGYDEDDNAITAEDIVLVADRDDAGARTDEDVLSLTVDWHNASEGDTLVAVVSMPRPGAWMLVGSDADGLDGMRLVHLVGTSKRLEFPLGERSVPGIQLHAASVFARRYHEYSTAIAVAPRAGSLTVDLVADQPQYGPRQEATWSLKVSDEDGKPVRAEVSLAVADEATFVIQEDFAGDPRTSFFSNQTYREGLRTTSGLAQRGHVKLVKHADYGLIDEQELAERLGKKAGPPEEEHARYQSDDEVTTTEAFGLKEVVSRGFSLFAMAPEPKPKPPAGGPAVTVRSDFRSTVLWQPDLLTDAQGKGSAKLTFGDALTTWRATARVATAGNQFGMAVVKVRTTQPLIARLQAPRFFVVGDRVVVSLVVSNTSDQVQVVTPSLVAEGLALDGMLRAGVLAPGAAPTVTVPAHGDARVDWQVTAKVPGSATLTVEARGQGASDAMRLSYPVHQHGIDKLLASAGKLRDGPLTLTLDLPAARSATTLTLQVAPSLATTMLDALPYLIDYPYGCTEQTMSRFLPTVIVSRTLTKLGLDPEVAMTRTFGGIEAASAARLHPKGRKHLESIAQMSREGLERLADFQHDNGAWGWWKDDDDDPWMTAYVVWGLSLTADAEVELNQDLAKHGAQWLEAHLVELAGEPDLQAWSLHAIAVEAGEDAAEEFAQRPLQMAAFTNLWQRRNQLNAFGRALLALCAHHFGEKEKALALVRALENGVRRDLDPAAAPALGQPAAPGAQALATAHWGGDRLGARWSDSPIETTAFVLRALLAIEPANPLVDASATWLIQNRRGAQWTNTRDSALVVLALSQYLTVTGEAAGEVAYELTVNGTSVEKRTLSVDEALAAPTRLQVPAALVRDGANRITLTRTAGTGPLYLSAQATFFSQEVPVPPAGNQVFVRRQYHRLAARPTLLNGPTYERIPLNDQERITSGERVEVVLTIEVKNDYEYLLFEDLKPAGFEAVDLLSGKDLDARELRADAINRRATDPRASLIANDSDYTPRTAWIHRELRDRQVALFISRLPQGVWEVRYQLRAESPGTFHALPVLAHAMYVPEIRGNSAEVRVVIEDRKD